MFTGKPNRFSSYEIENLLEFPNNTKIINQSMSGNDKSTCQYWKSESLFMLSQEGTGQMSEIKQKKVINP